MPQILENVLQLHELDPNFPAEVLEKVKTFLADDDVFVHPEAHSMLIQEMKVEAALITNDSPYAEVRAVVSNTDDPSLPCVSLYLFLSMRIDRFNSRRCERG